MAARRCERLVAGLRARVVRDDFCVLLYRLSLPHVARLVPCFPTETAAIVPTTVSSSYFQTARPVSRHPGPTPRGCAQVRRHCRAAIRVSGLERGGPIDALVLVGSLLRQVPHHRLVAVLRRDVQGRCAAVSCLVLETRGEQNETQTVAISTRRTTLLTHAKATEHGERRGGPLWVRVLSPPFWFHRGFGDDLEEGEIIVGAKSLLRSFPVRLPHR